MQIKNIKVSNFKSFDEIDIDLGRFNVLIGANASGKSNFINIFKFLKDISQSGLDNAISIQGGVEYVRNINIGYSKNLSIELNIDSRDIPINFGVSGKNDRKFDISIHSFMYKISIEFYKKRYRIFEERLIANCNFVESDEKKRKIGDDEKIGKGKIIFINDRGKFKNDLEPKDIKIRIGDIKPWFFTSRKESKLLSKESLIPIRSPLFFSPVSYAISIFFNAISIYDIDPKQSKRSTLITGKTELEPNASNLAIVLKNILDDKRNSERISNLVKDFLPFIDGITVEKLADKSLLASLKEIYSKKKLLPASLVSDGTINITALIIVLYFEKKPLVIIEEPERNIHPYLISKVIEVMKDVSENLKKQIIVTTHNPEVVKYAGVENILLVYRNDKGFSKISRPSGKSEVKIFLENKMGIEELYVQNLLNW